MRKLKSIFSLLALFCIFYLNGQAGISSYIFLGYEQLRAENYEQAEFFYKTAFENDADSFPALEGLIIALSGQSKHKEIVYLVNSVDINSYSSEQKESLLLWNAYSHYQLKYFLEAQYYYRKTLNINPSNTTALAGLGWSYYLSGKYLLSQAAFRNAISREATNLSAANGLTALDKLNHTLYTQLSYLKKRNSEFNPSLLLNWYNHSYQLLFLYDSYHSDYIVELDKTIKRDSYAAGINYSIFPDLKVGLQFHLLSGNYDYMYPAQGVNLFLSKDFHTGFTIINSSLSYGRTSFPIVNTEQIEWQNSILLFPFVFSTSLFYQKQDFTEKDFFYPAEKKQRFGTSFALDNLSIKNLKISVISRIGAKDFLMTQDGIFIDNYRLSPIENEFSLLYNYNLLYFFTGVRTDYKLNVEYFGGIGYSFRYQSI